MRNLYLESTGIVGDGTSRRTGADGDHRRRRDWLASVIRHQSANHTWLGDGGAKRCHASDSRRKEKLSRPAPVRTLARWALSRGAPACARRYSIEESPHHSPPGV